MVGVSTDFITDAEMVLPIKASTNNYNKLIQNTVCNRQVLLDVSWRQVLGAIKLRLIGYGMATQIEGSQKKMRLTRSRWHSSMDRSMIVINNRSRSRKRHLE